MLIEKPRIPIRSVLLYGLWPNFIKIFLYRLKGYRIGKGVSIGLGAVIYGEHVEIGDHTSVGFLTIVRGKEIRLGPYVQIGSMTFLDTPHLEIGEGTKINEQVFVGGLQFPHSRFVVGRNCSIMQLSFINPAPSVVIGDDCAIGGHCLIFGHNSSLNQFDGYAVDFAPIEIGRAVGLAWRVFLLPGTKIGDGSIVGANSVVSGTIPPYSMAAGFPAKIVGRPPVFPKPLSAQEKVEMFRHIVEEMIRFFLGSGLRCEKNGLIYEVRKPSALSRRARRWRLRVTDGDVQEAAKSAETEAVDVFLSLWEIPSDVRASLTSRNIVWIDVTKREQPRVSNNLGDEVLSFLRRYGVRTLRYPGLPITTVEPARASEEKLSDQ